MTKYTVEVTTAYEVEAASEDGAFNIITKALSSTEQLSDLTEWHKATDNWQEITAIYPNDA